MAAAVSAVERVAVIGTGRMGAAMVERLRGAGYAVTAYNRSRAKAEAVAARSGAAVAETAREAASAAEVVLVSLADDAAVTAVYGGADGLAAGLRADTVVLEASTVAPDTVAAVRALVDKQGAVLLDTPVSGSVPYVEQGRLTVLAGGPGGGLDRARPVLEALAARIVHVGESGSGAAMKLAVNSVVHGLNQALSEALVLAERAGVARETAYDVFAAGAAGAPFVQYKREAYLRPEDTPVAFTLELAAKDLDLALALAERVGVPMEQAETNRRLARTAADAGYGQRDLSTLAEYLRTR